MEKMSRVRLLKVGLFTSILSVFLQTSSAYASGISTISQLLAVTGEQNYVLMNNLDLATGDANNATEVIELADEVTEGSLTYISNAFTGILDGAGFSISGLTKPLFDAIGGDGENAEVSNVTLIASEDGVSGRGLLANDTYIGTIIENVHGIGDVNGGVSANVGGLVGTLGTGELRESSFTGDVTGTNVVGGLVGEAYGDISSSTFSGSVTGERYVGGIAGSTGAPTISNSSASGGVTGLAGGEGNIGGLVGGGSATITDSHADVNVTGAATFSMDDNGNIINPGTSNTGGLLGLGDAQVTISNSYSTGTVTGDTKVGGLVGMLAGGYIEESYSTGDVFGRTNGSIGGLVGYVDSGSYEGTARGIVSGNNGTDSSTLSALIKSSYATGDVTQTDSGSDGGGVGGLVGRLYSGTVLNSYSTGNVLGETTVGGLVGRVDAYGENSGLMFEGAPYLNYYGLIENSYATGTINNGYNGANRLGGLVGIFSGGKIVNSYATTGGLGIDASQGCDHIGGLVGDGQGGAGIIEDSYAHIDGNLSAGCGQVGGLAGSMGANSIITDSFAYVGGSISGGSQVGGLVGVIYGAYTLTGSYASVGTLQAGGGSDLVGTLTGDNTGVSVDFSDEQIIDLPALPSILSVVNTDDETESFAVSSCFNSGLPYLIVLESSYISACSSPNNNGPRDRNILFQSKTLEKSLNGIGFKSSTLISNNSGFEFLKNSEDNRVSTIRLFEFFDYTNSSILLNKEDGLQLSISSYYKEPVEIWTQGLDGEYLYLGLVEFDKDGKAILPTLKFDTANTYQLLMIKAADKVSEKPNLERKIGEININVI